MDIAITPGPDGPHPLDLAAQVVGGRSALAERLGVSVSSIGNWKARGVPIEQCVPIERVTGGKVNRPMLRPNDWREIWPELAAAAAAAAGADPLADASQPVLFLADKAAPATDAAGVGHG